jgi:TonB family protein
MRLRHILWLAKNAPGTQVLGAPLAIPHPPAPSEAALYEELRRTWLAQLAANPKDHAILDHATNFLRFSDPEVVEKAAQQAIDETHRAAVFLGDLYALAILGVTAVDPRTGHPVEAPPQLPSTPFAARARAALAKTEDLRILLSALSTVSAAGPSLAQAGRTPAGYLDLCTELLTRAKSYYPETPARCDAAPQPSVGEARIMVGGNVQQALLLKQVPPVYPPEARARRITGTVTFRATIGKDGSVQALELLRGPLPLYASARDAVSRWKYKPTLLEGQPVEVLTRIDVNYTQNPR